MTFRANCSWAVGSFLVGNHLKVLNDYAVILELYCKYVIVYEIEQMYTLDWTYASSNTFYERKLTTLSRGRRLKI